MDEEAEGWSGGSGGGDSKEHVRTIAAVQRVQASQANYSDHSAHDISRPKLRDNRRASCHCCRCMLDSLSSCLLSSV